MFAQLPLLGFLAISASYVQAATLPLQRRGGSRVPNLAVDPNTVSSCSWWWDANDGIPCEEIVEYAGLKMEVLAKWNPSLTSCADWKQGQSYCIEAPANGGLPTITSTTSTAVRPTTTTTSTTKAPSTTQPPTTRPSTTQPPTTTKPSNGVATPEPFQPGMTESCGKFHKVVSGDQCGAIATRYGIPLNDLLKLNPGVGSNCQSLWLDYYVCVAAIGSAPAPAPAPTTTKPSNGVATPEPTQPGMVGNCNRFHQVAAGDTWEAITAKAGISRAQFAGWNPQTGGTACSSLWLGYYVCTGVVGTTNPPPTTTHPGNGVQTPQPVQGGMVAGCKKFHFVGPGETCAVISSRYGISTSNFIKWNPAAGSSCAGLWANTYACVSI